MNLLLVVFLCSGDFLMCHAACYDVLRSQQSYFSKVLTTQVPNARTKKETGNNSYWLKSTHLSTHIVPELT